VTESSKVREFDLNIEKVLDGWLTSHAIRELIADALDEQALTSTADIVVEPHESICRVSRRSDADKRSNAIPADSGKLRDALARLDWSLRSALGAVGEYHPRSERAN